MARLLNITRASNDREHDESGERVFAACEKCDDFHLRMRRRTKISSLEPNSQDSNKVAVAGDHTYT